MYTFTAELDLPTSSAVKHKSGPHFYGPPCTGCPLHMQGNEVCVDGIISHETGDVSRDYLTRLSIIMRHNNHVMSHRSYYVIGLSLIPRHVYLTGLSTMRQVIINNQETSQS